MIGNHILDNAEEGVFVSGPGSQVFAALFTP